MKTRSLGRELAFKYLYSLDVAGKDETTDFLEFSIDQESSAEARLFAEQLVRGTLKAKPELITAIEETAKNWPWRRMPVVDRNVILAGACELMSANDIPASVTINEFVDLAKKYGSNASGSFVNGILDALKKRLAPAKNAKE